MPLLTTVEHDGHTVAFGVVVHDAGDVDAGSLAATAAKDAAGTDTEAVERFMFLEFLPMVKSVNAFRASCRPSCLI